MDVEDNKDNLKIILDDSSNLSLNQIKRLLNKMSSPTPYGLPHIRSQSERQTDSFFHTLYDESIYDTYVLHNSAVMAICFRILGSFTPFVTRT